MARQGKVLTQHVHVLGALPCVLLAACGLLLTVGHAQSKELRTKQSELGSHTAAMEPLEKLRDGAAAALTKATAELQAAQELLPAAETIHRLAMRYNAAKSDVAALQEELGADVSGDALEDAERAVADLDRARDDIDTKRDAAGAALQRHRDRETRLRNAVYAAKEELDKLRKTAAKVTELESSVAQLRGDVDASAVAVAALEAQRPVLRRKLARMESARDEVVQRHDAKVQVIQDEYSECRAAGAALDRMAEQIRSVARNNPKQRLQEAQKAQQDSKAALHDLEQQAVALENEIADINAKLAQSAALRSDLEDIIKYMELLDKLEDASADVKDLKDELQDADGSLADVGHEVELSRKKLGKLNDHRSKKVGATGVLRQAVSDLDHKLSHKDYVDVAARVRDAHIQHETAKLAVSDLETYHAALDTALMHYHSMKIKVRC